MKTYPLETAPDGRLFAFEIANTFMGPSSTARVLRQVEGVTDVVQRRLFSREPDVHVKFIFRGHPCIVWEPFGDNSRYWIGPDQPDSFTGDMGPVEAAFALCRSPARQRVLLLVVAIAVILAGIWFKRAVAIDSCLDRGGRWNYEIAACDGASE